MTIIKKTKGEVMSDGNIPTPDQAEQAIFIIKWWKEFIIGFIAIVSGLLGVFATVKKGQKITSIGEKELSNRMQICKHELKNEIHDDIRTIMHEHKEDMKEDFNNMLEKIELMIKVATK